MNSQQSHNGHALNLHAGDWVEVRSKSEILATLDGNGRLEALPFMPEMLQYCGKRFRVFKRAHKTCDTIEKTGIRRMTNAVHLEGVRCDGTAHGGCQAGCLIFWKETWLKRIPADAVKASTSPSHHSQTHQYAKSSITEPDLMRTTRADPPESGEVIYTCQATDLRKATSYMPPWDPRQYIMDVRSGNVSLSTCLNEGGRQLLIWAFNAIQSFRKGSQWPFMGGKLRQTPKHILNLQPGDLVQVKTKDEILETLDTNNRNRGLWFDVEMVKYCGGKFRVLRRVERIINEKTGRMMPMPNDCVILQGVTCEAHYRKFCPRSIYPYWREIWLRKAEPTS